MRLPTLFIGHGSPMNALGGNAYARRLATLGQELPRPQAIVVVSAHWRTPGTQVLRSDAPATIHDFAGFPKALYEMRYPAPGAPELAERIAGMVGGKTTAEWGLDHGAWTVLKHMYPAAQIPVLQVSMDKRAHTRDHYEIAKQLRPLRDEGVLIVGSGNVTHNLGEMDWDGTAAPFPWAVEFDRLIAEALDAKHLACLLDGDGIAPEVWRRALPTNEHFLPLVYALGSAYEDDQVSYPYEEMQNGSLSMRSVRFG